ncbi:long-chain-fatty-acid--CoA ligase [Synechococcus phage S-CAM9]|uniref:Long-chain-fatty-acid--CoA ligase n=1 Tax=Synechococcus phage S-CAM9 TaxID=1883369 RepID=A0A1D8KPU1_9CAUD|nr:long-chain-fatty-acid--CoA ligase [Synechococcus phage S-CAM9]AOV60212.1 long-chain-fatty-acid--CoA ligase [Synechococcus phage S-CAM9]AOV60439.1 long-chain-fatty-acid--CoA ligase [Synechococcus phage S-CAM9]AOV60668.1 long-chain-fatty-acid--CoA ligase [Synechococcus phage S-CAM9]
MGGVAAVRLTSAVGVGARALGHGEDELRLAGFAGGQFGHSKLARGDAGIKFGAGHGVGVGDLASIHEAERGA